MAKDEANRPTDDTPDAARKAGKGRQHLVTGAAIGIGSAALVAALLYARTAKKDDKPGGKG